MADNETPGAGEQPAAAAPITVTELPLLERIIAEGKMARDESQQPYARDLIGEFVHQILDEGLTVSKDTVAMIEQQVAKIDELLSAQLNEILHSEEYQRLEATWRGLHFLVMNSETGTRMKLRLLNVSKKELLNDLEK